MSVDDFPPVSPPATPAPASPNSATPGVPAPDSAPVDDPNNLATVDPGENTDAQTIDDTAGQDDPNQRTVSAMLDEMESRLDEAERNVADLLVDKMTDVPIEREDIHLSLSGDSTRPNAAPTGAAPADTAVDTGTSGGVPVTAAVDMARLGGFDADGVWHDVLGRFARKGWSGLKHAALESVLGDAPRSHVDEHGSADLHVKDPTLARRLRAVGGRVRARWGDTEHALVDVDGRDVKVPWSALDVPTPSARAAAADINDMVDAPNPDAWHLGGPPTTVPQPGDRVYALVNGIVDDVRFDGMTDDGRWARVTSNDQQSTMLADRTRWYATADDAIEAAHRAAFADPRSDDWGQGRAPKEAAAGWRSYEVEVRTRPLPAHTSTRTQVDHLSFAMDDNRPAVRARSPQEALAKVRADHKSWPTGWVREHGDDGPPTLYPVIAAEGALVNPRTGEQVRPPQTPRPTDLHPVEFTPPAKDDIKFGTQWGETVARYHGNIVAENIRKNPDGGYTAVNGDFLVRTPANGKTRYDVAVDALRASWDRQHPNPAAEAADNLAARQHAWDTAQAAYNDALDAAGLPRNTDTNDMARRPGPALYGDYALFARFNGITTDGTGRVATPGDPTRTPIPEPIDRFTGWDIEADIAETEAQLADLAPDDTVLAPTLRRHLDFLHQSLTERNTRNTPDGTGDTNDRIRPPRPTALERARQLAGIDTTNDLRPPTEYTPRAPNRHNDADIRTGALAANGGIHGPHATDIANGVAIIDVAYDDHGTIRTPGILAPNGAFYPSAEPDIAPDRPDFIDPHTYADGYARMIAGIDTAIRVRPAGEPDGPIFPMHTPSVDRNDMVGTGQAGTTFDLPVPTPQPFGPDGQDRRYPFVDVVAPTDVRWDHRPDPDFPGETITSTSIVSQTPGGVGTEFNETTVIIHGDGDWYRWYVDGANPTGGPLDLDWPDPDAPVPWYEDGDARSLEQAQTDALAAVNRLPVIAQYPPIEMVHTVDGLARVRQAERDRDPDLARGYVRSPSATFGRSDRNDMAAPPLPPEAQSLLGSFRDLADDPHGRESLARFESILTEPNRDRRLRDFDALIDDEGWDPDEWPEIAPVREWLARTPADSNDMALPPGADRFLAAGETVEMPGGITSTPFPKIDLTTNQRSANTLRRGDQWLMENAKRVLAAQGDPMNQIAVIDREKPGKLPAATKDYLNAIIFGAGDTNDLVVKLTSKVDTLTPEFTPELAEHAARLLTEQGGYPQSPTDRYLASNVARFVKGYSTREWVDPQFTTDRPDPDAVAVIQAWRKALVDHVAAKGGDSVTLHRGVVDKGTDPFKPQRTDHWSNEFNDVATGLEASGITSWTSVKAQAKEFGGHLVTEDIPVDQMLGRFGSINGEVLVANDPLVGRAVDAWPNDVDGVPAAPFATFPARYRAAHPDTPTVDTAPTAKPIDLPEPTVDTPASTAVEPSAPRPTGADLLRGYLADVRNEAPVGADTNDMLFGRPDTLGYVRRRYDLTIVGGDGDPDAPTPHGVVLIRGTMAQPFFDATSVTDALDRADNTVVSRASTRSKQENYRGRAAFSRYERYGEEPFQTKALVLSADSAARWRASYEGVIADTERVKAQLAERKAARKAAREAKRVGQGTLGFDQNDLVAMPPERRAAAAPGRTAWLVAKDGYLGRVGVQAGQAVQVRHVDGTYGQIDVLTDDGVRAQAVKWERFSPEAPAAAVKIDVPEATTSPAAEAKRAVAADTAARVQAAGDTGAPVEVADSYLARYGAPKGSIITVHYLDDRNAVFNVDGRQVKAGWTRFTNRTPIPDGDGWTLETPDTDPTPVDTNDMVGDDTARTILRQIGGMNVAAISGGRSTPITDANGDTIGVRLPVAAGYRVDVTLDRGTDTYTVSRVFSRSGVDYPKGTQHYVYADAVGDVAYLASSFRSDPFGTPADSNDMVGQLTLGDLAPSEIKAVSDATVVMADHGWRPTDTLGGFRSPDGHVTVTRHRTANGTMGWQAHDDRSGLFTQPATMTTTSVDGVFDWVDRNTRWHTVTPVDTTKLVDDRTLAGWAADPTVAIYPTTGMLGGDREGGSYGIIARSSDWTEIGDFATSYGTRINTVVGRWKTPGEAEGAYADLRRRLTTLPDRPEGPSPFSRSADVKADAVRNGDWVINAQGAAVPDGGFRVEGTGTNPDGTVHLLGAQVGQDITVSPVATVSIHRPVGPGSGSRPVSPADTPTDTAVLEPAALAMLDPDRLDAVRHAVERRANSAAVDTPGHAQAVSILARIDDIEADRNDMAARPMRDWNVEMTTDTGGRFVDTVKARTQHEAIQRANRSNGHYTGGRWYAIAAEPAPVAAADVNDMARRPPERPPLVPPASLTFRNYRRGDGEWDLAAEDLPIEVLHRGREIGEMYRNPPRLRDPENEDSGWRPDGFSFSGEVPGYLVGENRGMVKVSGSGQTRYDAVNNAIHNAQDALNPPAPAPAPVTEPTPAPAPAFRRVTWLGDPYDIDPNGRVFTPDDHDFPVEVLVADQIKAAVGAPGDTNDMVEPPLGVNVTLVGDSATDPDWRFLATDGMFYGYGPTGEEALAKFLTVDRPTTSVDGVDVKTTSVRLDEHATPPKAGTAAIPDGAIRLYTWPSDDPDLSLTMSTGLNGTDTRPVWAQKFPPVADVIPYVEFYAHPGEVAPSAADRYAITGHLDSGRIVSYSTPTIDALNRYRDRTDYWTPARLRSALAKYPAVSPEYKALAARLAELGEPLAAPVDTNDFRPFDLVRRAPEVDPHALAALAATGVPNGDGRVLTADEIMQMSASELRSLDRAMTTWLARHPYGDDSGADLLDMVHVDPVDPTPEPAAAPAPAAPAPVDNGGMTGFVQMSPFDDLPAPAPTPAPAPSRRPAPPARPRVVRGTGRRAPFPLRTPIAAGLDDGDDIVDIPLPPL